MLLGVAIVTGAGGNLAKILAVPEFVAVVMLTCLLVHLLEERGAKPLIPVMMLELALLAGFLLIAWRLAPLPGPDSLETLMVALVAVAAMAVQNAIMRRLLRSLPATTVMTSNLSQVAVDVVDAALGGPLAKDARARLGSYGPVVLAFAAGAGIAGLGYLAWGIVSLLGAIAALAFAVGVAVSAREP